MSGQVSKLLEVYKQVLPASLLNPNSPGVESVEVGGMGVLKGVEDLDFGSKSSRQSIWELYSAYPVTEKIRAEIKKRLIREIKDLGVESEKNEESVSLTIPQRVYLPFGKLPQVDTYLRASRGNNVLELPQA